MSLTQDLHMFISPHGILHRFVNLVTRVYISAQTDEAITKLTT